MKKFCNHQVIIYLKMKIVKIIKTLRKNIK